MRQLFSLFQQYLQRDPYYKQAQRQYLRLLDQRDQQSVKKDGRRNRLQEKMPSQQSVSL